MTDLRLFRYVENDVRVVVIDGNPFWVAKDVCSVFGDTNYRRSVARLDEAEKGVSQIHTPGGAQEMTVVTEAGLYSLLFYMQPQKANMPDEQIQKRIDALTAFKRWVTREVLPFIRKHGAYMTPETIEAALLDPDTIIQLATKLKDERQKRIQAEAIIQLGINLDVGNRYLHSAQLVPGNCTACRPPCPHSTSTSRARVRPT